MTVFEFRRTSATWLFTVVASSVLLFGTVDAAAVALVVVAIFGLAGVWAWYAMKGRISFVWDRLYLALALVPAVALIQVLIGTPHIYATMGEMVKWLAYLTFFVLCVNVFADAWIRRRFGRWLAVFGFLISGLALLQHYSSPEMAYWFREAPGGLIFGPFADRNHFAILIELLFPGALMLAISDRDRRFLYFVLCALMYASVIASGSRTGFILVSAEFLVIMAFRLSQAGGMRRKEAARDVVVSLLLIAVLLGVVFVAGFRGLVERFGEDELRSGMSRFTVAAATWDLFLERPLLGHGLGCFQAVFPSSSPQQDGLTWHHAHCDPIQLSMEIGATGLLVQALVFGGIVTSRRSGRLWLTAALPLAAGWAHSCVEFPLQMPSLVLTALALLALFVTGRERRNRPASDRTGANR